MESTHWTPHSANYHLQINIMSILHSFSLFLYIYLSLSSWPADWLTVSSSSSSSPSSSSLLRRIIVEQHFESIVVCGYVNWQQLDLTIAYAMHASSKYQIQTVKFSLTVIDVSTRAWRNKTTKANDIGSPVGRVYDLTLDNYSFFCVFVCGLLRMLFLGHVSVHTTADIWHNHTANDSHNFLSSFLNIRSCNDR